MPQITQRSFISGEISPALQSRADLTKYATGLNLCENFIIRAQGGAYSRPGLRFIKELSSTGEKGRLIPFSFNTEQTYMLVFENLKMFVIKDGAVVLDGGGILPYFLVTPYITADLPNLRFAQNADTMTLVHPDHDPANLGRLADNNWTLTDIDYASSVTAPFIPTITVIGSGPGTYNKSYFYQVTTVTNGVESLPSDVATILPTPSLTTTAGLNVNWADVTGADYYRVYKSYGGDIFGWIGDAKASTFDDYNIAPITSDTPPEDRQPFAGADDKPSAVTYYQQRQVFANTNNEPQVVYTTQTNNYNSLRTSGVSRDDDAVTFTIAANQVNEIRHLLALDSLILLTSGGEWIMTEGQDAVLTPSTAGVRIQSYNGCSNVPPVVINSTALYLQEKGTRLRDLGYEFASDKFTGSDLSLMAEHLFEGYQIVEMAFAAEPYSIVWCVRDDGVMLALTYQREHQVWAWHHHTTQGEFESVATVTEDDRDAVYVIVKRTINGVERRFVERMEKREVSDSADAFYLDSGLTYDGAPATVISSIGHLIGETVSILADGYVIDDQVVAQENGGQITLTTPASKVHVGLSYLPVIETLDIDVASPTETLKAQSVSVSKVTIEVESTRGGWVGARKDSGAAADMQEIKPRYDSDNYDQLALRTYQESVFVEPQWSKGGGVRIEQRDPLPMAVLSVIPQVDVGGN